MLGFRDRLRKMQVIKWFEFSLDVYRRNLKFWEKFVKLDKMHFSVGEWLLGRAL